jgi:hypothetical protein
MKRLQTCCVVVATMFVVLVWGAGCADPTPAPRRPVLSDCTYAWQVEETVNSDALTMPESMVWADSILYQAAFSSILAAAAEAGVQETLVADVYPKGIWVEGDEVLYSTDNQLVQVPRNGGTPTVILDGGSTPDPSAPSGQALMVAGQRILDAEYFYWTSKPLDGQGTYISRMPRVGGTAELFAELPILDVGGIAVVSDGVVAAGFNGKGYSAAVAPFGGGPLRMLAPTLHDVLLLSVESAGVLWSTPSTPNADGMYALMLSPADGSSVSPMRQILSSEISWDWAYPDGVGGHFLSAQERFDDGDLHRSVFLVSTNGNVTRLACDPSSAFSDIRGAALSPDALYVTVNHFGSAWSTVKVLRPAQHP